MPDPLRHWSAATVDIAERLLEASEPSRSDAIARELARPERTTRQLLAQLHGGRLIARGREHTGEPGRPAWCYYLRDDQIPGAERAVNTPPELWDSLVTGQYDDAAATEARTERREPILATTLSSPRGSPAAVSTEQSGAAYGQLSRGQELVLVDINGPALSDLLEVLAGTKTIAAAAWIARIGDELAIAFDPTGTRSAAGDLLAVLAGARLSVHLAVVGQVAPANELVEQSQRLAPEIRRARSEHDAHRAPH
jgi:hypothetical protein